MPMIAFIGVRISWLMVARKALLAWLAASAAAWEFCACWNRRRVLNGDGRLLGKTDRKIQVGLSERSGRGFIAPHSQHTDHPVAGFERREHGHFPLLVRVRDIRDARIGQGVVDELGLPGQRHGAGDAFAHAQGNTPVLLGKHPLSQHHRQVSVQFDQAQDDIPGIQHLQRPVGNLFQHSRKVERGGESLPISTRAAVSLARRWVSSNRRAFSSATPMLAATVWSRRNFDSSKKFSCSKTLDLDDSDDPVAANDRDQSPGFGDVRTGYMPGIERSPIFRIVK